MNIKEYILKQGLTSQSLAALMDCSICQINRVRQGKKVSKKFARQLQYVSRGLVSVEEVMNPKQEVIPLPTPLYPPYDSEVGPIEKIA
jgi:transcriptional regulator with XRE-family HTH domain